MNLEDIECSGLNPKDKIHRGEEDLLWGQEEDSSNEVCVPIGTISNATVANRKGIFRAIACSGKSLRYDKPSLKVGELSRMCQLLAQGGDKSRPGLTGGFYKRMSFVQGPGEGSQWGVEVESKSTSWIVRATILGFIYTLDVLLSKLSRSVSSK